MKSQHFGVLREWPWPAKGAIYKPHHKIEPLPLGASFCEDTGHGGALLNGKIPTASSRWGTEQGGSGFTLGVAVTSQARPLVSLLSGKSNGALP